ncbi:pitrilysin family protein [Nitrospirillum sp. BR 11164]|uniref:M16 family metallopeptidase n=1 Tax=Nitrospirillum sp. BR 11164 TaxID=3104324 RepID=UPI002B00348A|nr:pitrilysin family protein [Nitrospirillum sp. BR 11164]MEA1651542.1 pitrilysin family protein [Nitrospirillum sp. BR 11164]
MKWGKGLCGVLALGLLAALPPRAPMAAEASPAEALPVRASLMERVVSPGGIEVWLVRDAKNPIIALDWSFRGGAATDPADQLGLAAMAAGLLDEGAGDLDSAAFQNRLADHSIGLAFNASRDWFSGALLTLRENREEAFTLARLALTAPRFDADAVARIRGQLQVAVRREEADPVTVAYHALARQLFPGHPYGRPLRGTSDTLAAITADDLRGFADRRLAREGLLVTAAGDIDPAELAAAVDWIFGALPAASAPATIPDARPATGAPPVAVPWPGPQSLFVQAGAGIPPGDPDWPAALLLSHILGGEGLESRLADAVRTRSGLSYDVQCNLQSYAHADLFIVSGSTANATVEQALGLVRHTLAEVAAHGVTARELRDAQTYLTGSFPLQFTNDRAIAALLLDIRRDGYAAGFLDHRNALLRRVTLADVQRVAARLLRPDAMATVVVGGATGPLR